MNNCRPEESAPSLPRPTRLRVRTLIALTIIILSWESLSFLAPETRTNLLLESARFSAETVLNKDTKEEEASRDKSCRFEDATGYFENTSDGSHSWNWIHNSSSSSKGEEKERQDCSIVDHLNPLRRNEYKTSKPLAFLMIGDSLDHRVVQFLCPKGFRSFPIAQAEKDTAPALINRGKFKDRAGNICTNDHVTFCNFKIFGMHHGCMGWGMKDDDSRVSNTTAERVETYLPVDILSRLDNETNYVVLASSALWDLSAGCNDQLGVSAEYKEQYRQGIVDLHAAIRKILPTAPIFWRTSPPVTIEYDAGVVQQGFGRNRVNQGILNALLRETVSERKLGIIVDWWEQAKHLPESILTKHSDGRHYHANPSQAFFNMYLNAVFERYPSLLS